MAALTTNIADKHDKAAVNGLNGHALSGNTFEAAAKVRVAPGHTSWWSSRLDVHALAHENTIHATVLSRS